MKLTHLRFPRLLRPTPIREVLEEELYICQRQLLEATTAAEYWTAQADMLHKRLARLQGYTSPQPTPQKEPTNVEPT